MSKNLLPEIAKSGLTTYLTLHFLKQDGYIVATRKPKRHSLP